MYFNLLHCEPVPEIMTNAIERSKLPVSRLTGPITTFGHNFRIADHSPKNRHIRCAVTNKFPGLSVLSVSRTPRTEIDTVR